MHPRRFPFLLAAALALLPAPPARGADAPPGSTESVPPIIAFRIDPATHVVLSGTTALVLDCDLRNLGAFEPAPGSSVVLTGYGTPMLQGAPLADLTLALHGDASLLSDETVAGTLTLGSGRLYLAGHDLTAAAISGGSATSYVMTPDTLGRLVRTVGSGASVLFPVGNATYDPLSLRTGTGSDVFRVAALDAPPATGLVASEALIRAWAIAHPHAAGVNGPLTVSVQWNAAETGPTFDRSLGSPTSARAWRWLGGTWVVQPGVRRSDNGLWPAVDSLVTLDGGLWTLAGVTGQTAVDPAPEPGPERLALAAPAPNPVRGAGWLRYGLPQRTHVTLALYTVLGQRVATLVDAEQDAGWHAARLDGAPLHPGVYFLRLAAGAETRSAKLAVIR